MNLTRRSLLIAAPTVGLIPMAQATVMPLDELKALIETHKGTLAIDHEKWEAVGEIAETIEGKVPRCRVQVSEILGFRDENGNNTFRPIYAYDEAEIESRRDRDIEVLAGQCGPSQKGVERIKEIREKRTAWANAKKAELVALKAERRRVEDESGYTAALKAAHASADAVRAIEAEIIAYIPSSFETAARKATWVVDAYRDGNSYLSDDGDEALLSALKAIGEAAGG